MIKKKIVSMLILMVYVIFTSGCVNEPDAEDIELIAEEIAVKMQEKENSVEDSSYTLCMTAYFEGEKIQESEFGIMYKKPNMKKTITKGTENESVMIYDGKIEWLYDPETNVVQKIIVPEEYQIEIDYFQLFNDTLNEYDISVLENDKIHGRTAYLLEAKPKEGIEESILIDEIKIWVDGESWMPLKYEIYQGTQRIEIEIQDLKINTGIPDSEFVFNVPEGAEVVTMNFEDLLNKNISNERINVPADGGRETSMCAVV
ncbi:outer membrane lipoprotein carrier protein LolA [Methanosarcina hadiensis]|uniref:LolA family protein n=1 Tax=Methanosarcina hadiensis TaxID=3078083 RepID=UPI003977CB2C